MDDLNNMDQWKELADRINVIAEADPAIDKSKFSTDGIDFGQIATASICIRGGDDARISNEDDITQSGEIAHVNSESVPDVSVISNDEEFIRWARNAKKQFSTGLDIEIQDAEVIVQNTKGEVERININTNDGSLKAHIGEQNIIGHDCTFNGDHFQADITIEHEKGVFSTINAIKDRAGEYNTCKSIPTTIRIHLPEDISENARNTYAYFLSQENSGFGNLVSFEIV